MSEPRLYLAMVALDGEDALLAERVNQRQIDDEDVRDALAATAREIYPLGGADVRTTVPYAAGIPPEVLALLAGCAEVGAEGLDGDVEPDVLACIWQVIADLRTVALGVTP